MATRRRLSRKVTEAADTSGDPGDMDRVTITHRLETELAEHPTASKGPVSTRHELINHMMENPELRRQLINVLTKTFANPKDKANTIISFASRFKLRLCIHPKEDSAPAPRAPAAKLSRPHTVKPAEIDYSTAKITSGCLEAFHVIEEPTFAAIQVYRHSVTCQLWHSSGYA